MTFSKRKRRGSKPSGAPKPILATPNRVDPHSIFWTCPCKEKSTAKSWGPTIARRRNANVTQNSPFVDQRTLDQESKEVTRITSNLLMFGGLPDDFSIALEESPNEMDIENDGLNNEPRTEETAESSHVSGSASQKPVDDGLNKETWRDLAQLVQKESDPKKIVELVQRLIAKLDEEEQR